MKYRDYITQNIFALNSISLDDLECFSEEILKCHKRGGIIFFFGNGGSASTAAHASCDLSKGILVNSGESIRTLCLNDVSISYSAWINDEDPANVFVNLIRNFVRNEDLLIAISGSGNSENVIRAIRHSIACGIPTMAMLGFDGGRVKELPIKCLVVDSQDMQVIENCHVFVMHWLHKRLSELFI